MAKANRTTRLLFEVLSGYELRVIISKDVAATGRRLREDLKLARSAFVFKDDPPGVGWLVLSEDATPGLIGHEVYHAVVAILKHHGAKLDDEEQVAYWLEHIIDRVYRFMK